MALAPAPSAHAEAPAPRTDKIVRIAIDAEPAHLNPLLDPDLWGYRIAHDLLCEPLIRRRAGVDESAPATARFEGVLAERFRVDADERGIELWIRRGVRFHDGKPLTAFDVRVSIDLVRNSPQVAPRTQALLDDVLKVSLIGKDVVRLDLRRPSRRVLPALAAIDVLPASQFPGERLLFQPFNRHPICTGPFRLHEWKRGAAITLRRFPGYWGAASQPVPATPVPDAAAALVDEPPEELRFVIVPDGARSLSQLRQGQIDVVARVAPRYLQDQVEPAVQRGRWQMFARDANQVVAVVWNSRHPVLGIAAVRQTLAELFTRTRLRDRLTREVRAGLATPVTGPLLRDETEAQGATADGQTPEARTKAALAEADRQLDGAGVLRFSTGGARHLQGRPVRLKLLVPAGSTELVEVARRLAELAGRVGIKIETEISDLINVPARLRRGMFDAALVAWAWTGAPADADLEPLLRYVYPDKAPAALELATAFSAWRSPAGSSDAQRAASRLMALWQSEEPLTVLYRPRQLLVHNPTVAPLRPSASDDYVDLRALMRRVPHGVVSVMGSGRPAGLP